MPSNTKTSTKSIAPFKPTAHLSNTAKAAPQTIKQSLKVDTTPVAKAPVNPEQHDANPSDEENVRPAADAAEPLSPVDNTAHALAKAQERDLRAYEHDRQRTKRANERALNRARKAAGTTGYGPAGRRESAGAGVREDREARRKLRARFDVEVDAGVSAVDRAASPVRAAMLIEGLSAPGASACLGAIARANARAAQSVGGAGGVQVNFAELLEHSKRKAARKARDDEFELVPAVRAVIVLDDMPTHLVHDMEIDEPWEHIHREDEGGMASKGAEPSYAQVVRSPVE